MPAPAKYEWIRGQDEQWTVTVTSQETGALVDLTLIENAILTVKPFSGDDGATPLLQLTLGSGMSVALPQTGSNLGVLNVLASAAQTFAVPGGLYNMDVVIITDEGLRKFVIPPTTILFRNPVGDPGEP